MRTLKYPWTVFQYLLARKDIPFLFWNYTSNNTWYKVLSVSSDANETSRVDSLFTQHCAGLAWYIGSKCVTFSYVYWFAPFHNWMSVIHNVFVKFLQVIVFCKVESARPIDEHSFFNIQDVSKIFGVKKKLV